jgi:hypothetical protein
VGGRPVLAAGVGLDVSSNRVAKMAASIGLDPAQPRLLPHIYFFLTKSSTITLLIAF